jgi:lipoprotein-anchoring transpeptidase ErfK/SrfK
VGHRRLRLLLALPLAGLLAGCGTAAQDAAGRTQARPPSDAPHCSTGLVRAGGANVTVAAFVRSRARAFRRPGGRTFASFGRLNQNGYPTVFRVLQVIKARDCAPRWYRVQLPMKPNGVTGYVRASAVDTDRIHTRVVVDVSSRKLTFFRRGKTVLRTAVAVGSDATPTPTGNYYVNQRLIPEDTSGPFGPGAIGISAFSNVLTGWTQGGPVAIHGTNQPWLIGQAVSNGCIRVRNPALRKLFRDIPAGTPVLIRR